MAAVRTSGPVAQSIFRFAAQPKPRTRCAQCLKAQRCPFSSSRPRSQSSKRPLMTESAYRPQSLEPEMPPPPKNAGTPDTSISNSQGSLAEQSRWQGQTFSLREEEAQKSKPVPRTLHQQKPTVGSEQKTTAPSLNTSKPKRTSKLRPRKAPITLSPKAVSQLRELFEQPESKMIRVGVKNRGCSGLAYHLEYVDKPGAFDETVEQDGVKVLIDSKALFSIIGSEMDWLEDKLSARFIFRNPNITEQCGCGESFSIS